MTRVLILDCDGVMFDSREANAAYYNYILEKLGLAPITEEEVAYVHASTADEAVAYLLRRRGFSDMERYRKVREGMDYLPFIKLMRPEPHLRELLEALPRGIKRAISTNRTYTIEYVLEHFGLRDYFDLVVSALDVERPKPDPGSLYRVLEHFGLEPEEALFVGDTERDAEASRRAGVPFVAYKNEALRADHYIEDLLELLEIIRSGRS